METAKSGVETALNKVCLWASRVAGVILMFLVLVLVVDVFGRFVGYPILGSYEIVQYGFALVVCLSVAYAGVQGAHIAIDLLFNAFPERMQRVLSMVSEVLSMAILALIVWRLCASGLEAYAISERSSTLNIPVFFFALALAAGFALLVLVLLAQFLKAIGATQCRP
jgi:TRAP-type transport system small permease protein